jgi:predicted RNA-binding protein with PUA-like domain
MMMYCRLAQLVTALDASAARHRRDLFCSIPDAPRWDMVDIQYVRHFKRFLPLPELRKHSKDGGSLAGMKLFSHLLLSMQPVEQQHWDAVVALAEEAAAD